MSTKESPTIVVNDRDAEALAPAITRTAVTESGVDMSTPPEAAKLSVAE